MKDSELNDVDHCLTKFTEKELLDKKGNLYFCENCNKGHSESKIKIKI